MVQNRLMELARGLENGDAAPEMPYVLTGIMVLNRQVGQQCDGDEAQLTARFAEQGEALRKLHLTVAACGPAQMAYHQVLQRGVNSVTAMSEAQYGQFLREAYEPALKEVRSACGEVLNSAVVDANDAKMRDYAGLKADASRAQQELPAPPETPQP